MQTLKFTKRPTGTDEANNRYWLMIGSGFTVKLTRTKKHWEIEIPGIGMDISYIPDDLLYNPKCQTRREAIQQGQVKLDYYLTGREINILNRDYDKSARNAYFAVFAEEQGYIKTDTAKEGDEVLLYKNPWNAGYYNCYEIVRGRISRQGDTYIVMNKRGYRQIKAENLYQNGIYTKTQTAACKKTQTAECVV